MPPKKRVAIGKISSTVKKKRLERKNETCHQRNKRLADARRRAFLSRTSKTPKPSAISGSSSLESFLCENNAAFNALLQCTPVMDNLLFEECKKRCSSSRPRKHPAFNKSSKMQRLRRVRERLVGLLEQRYSEWQQKYSQRNSAIQNMPATKIKELLDPTEFQMDDINHFADFLIFDEPVEEIMNDMVRYVEHQFINMDDSVQKRESSECFENEAADYDSLHNSVTNDLSFVNKQMNDISTLKSNSQAFLPYIKEEIDEVVTFSDESYNILHGEIKIETSIKIETDSQSSFRSEDEIVSVNSLRMIDQGNTSPLNKNNEISGPSNVSCTTNCSTECHAERNENYDGKCQFIKLEFQEVNCNEGEKNCQQETSSESMYHKTEVPVRKNRKRIFPALNVSPKWKDDRITDYSRTNRDILNEKLDAKKCVTSNFSRLSQNPVISRDVSEENQTSVKTKSLKKNKLKKKHIRNNLKNKSICIEADCKIMQENVSVSPTKINLDEESYETRHIFDPDFGKIKISDIRGKI
ncbi:uncharacterized protein TNCT_97381 [Trichonephila clavata]|uniref:Uncharacterized protein n=1 Tax=Trichonephila clavata TaxID=2740835 RepID=A0A8X6HTC9_TRICU|nr:uncharacterized protein TNCT_97381 [Trichonephila clavata]